jgi:predicted RNA binding protein YcfA (HicA-like mRNA interferase family)
VSKLPAIFWPEPRRRIAKGRLCDEAQHDSHFILRRDDPFCQVVVPGHRVLDRGTLRGILRQAGLSVDEFVKLL